MGIRQGLMGNKNLCGCVKHKVGLWIVCKFVCTYVRVCLYGFAQVFLCVRVSSCLNAYVYEFVAHQYYGIQD